MSLGFGDSRGNVVQITIEILIVLALISIKACAFVPYKLMKEDEVVILYQICAADQFHMEIANQETRYGDKLRVITIPRDCRFDRPI